MVHVKKKPGQSNDALIGQFNREVASEEIIHEMKKREFALKPSQMKKYRKKLKQKMQKYSRS